MQPIITENREKIAELCRVHHVRRLSVFGSAVRDDFDAERSDVDFLVEFALPVGFRPARNFFALQRALSSVLERHVDLVIAGTVKNAVIRRNIEGDTTVLYAA